MLETAKGASPRELTQGQREIWTRWQNDFLRLFAANAIVKENCKSVASQRNYYLVFCSDSPDRELYDSAILYSQGHLQTYV